MDGQGYWHNRHGKYEHRKSIDYFHSSIRKDDQGFYLCQQLGDRVEKVYFRYEDTALFVFDIIPGRSMTLVLNTGRRLPLDPQKLFIRGDHLYLRDNDDRIKFSESSLMKLSNRLEVKDDQYTIRIGGRIYVIRQDE